jgi:hypothetical protein
VLLVPPELPEPYVIGFNSGEVEVQGCTVFVKTPPRFLRAPKKYVERPTLVKALDEVQQQGLNWLGRSQGGGGRRSVVGSDKGEFEFDANVAWTWLRRSQVKVGDRNGSFEGSNDLRDHSLATLVFHRGSERTRSITIPHNRDRAIRFLRQSLERLDENTAQENGWAQMGLGQTDKWFEHQVSSASRWTSCASPLDMENYYFRTLQLQREGGAEWDAWRERTLKEIAPLQVVAIGERFGSWDPIGKWRGETSCVHATAMTLLVYSTCLH